MCLYHITAAPLVGQACHELYFLLRHVFVHCTWYVITIICVRWLFHAM